MYTFSSRSDGWYESACIRFANILSDANRRGGIIAVRSSSRSWGRYAASAFLTEAFSAQGLYPIIEEEFFGLIPTESPGPLWMDTSLILAKEKNLRESQWMKAMEGIEHLVVFGTINAFLMRLFSLIAKRTFIWIVSHGPQFPCEGLIIFDLNDSDHFQCSGNSTCQDGIEYNQWRSRTTFDLLHVSTETVVSTMTTAQCITVIAFFAASNGKDVLGIHKAHGAKTPNERREITCADADVFNMRTVNRETLHKAYFKVIRSFYANFVEHAQVSYDDASLHRKVKDMSLQPSDLDIEVLCSAGYVRCLHARAPGIADYDYIEAHQDPHARYFTSIPFAILKGCCQRIGLSEKSYV
ncbi:hypothetical protein XU18_2998 [Perkinsela sp. CCAP 1560/4]|nr:hypothetical protein XU18_2998 [Perkinsela sp. CCAP 1560/4]|eukprot:KNH06061.1 hypothetical protein XU18_2998 [Perkinsela sp. CCAP 1560/4]